MSRINPDDRLILTRRYIFTQRFRDNPGLPCLWIENCDIYIIRAVTYKVDPPFS
jgi:hypothetical protein